MGNVLIPFDGSQMSRDALEFACERFGDEEMTVLFVVDTSITFEAELYVGEKLGDIYEKREEQGRELLEETEGIASEMGCSVTTTLDRGEPSRVILRQVEEGDFDHVIMGSHSQGRLERYFVGSVSERVVDRAPCSVTVVR